jgi:CTP:molybdopterin cytidylyltransferase MocA
VNAAKVLAFSFPQLVEGIRKKEGKQAELTAVIDDDLDRGEAAAGFAVEALEQQSISLAMLGQMPQIAAQAAREMGIG